MGQPPFFDPPTPTVKLANKLKIKFQQKGLSKGKEGVHQEYVMRGGGGGGGGMLLREILLI